MGKLLVGILILFSIATANANFELSRKGDQLQARGQNISVHALCNAMSASVACQAVSAPKAGICFSENEFTIIPSLPKTTTATIKLNTKQFSKPITASINSYQSSPIRSGITIFENEQQEIQKIQYLINDTQTGGEITLDLDQTRGRDFPGRVSGYMFDIGWNTKVELECTHL